MARDGQGLDVSNASAAAIEAIDLLRDEWLAFGKRLSDRLYVSYEQGLGTVTSSLVKLDYALSRRWSLRAETGTSSGWGVFYRFSWD